VIDLDRFLRSRVRVTNESGGRAYDTGLRTFDCPLCGDSKARGWLGTTGFAAGCFNPGCVANPQLPGGAVEWARRALRLQSRAEAWALLEREFGGATPAARTPLPRDPDFCRFPLGARDFDVYAPSPLQSEFEKFAERQWGLSVVDVVRWGLKWCFHGALPLRVIIPVVMGGRPVGFQARTIKRGVEPKYLTSKYGKPSDPKAECARPAAAMLFNADAMRPLEDVVGVEGAGDVMGWHRVRRDTPAVGFLGVALTPAKLSIISSARPRRFIVALDAEPEARARALSHVEDLRAWRVNAVLGRWVGGKDAGSGASLSIEDGEGTLSSAVRSRLLP